MVHSGRRARAAPAAAALGTALDRAGRRCAGAGEKGEGYREAPRNKCHASSNRCLTSSNKEAILILI